MDVIKSLERYLEDNNIYVMKEYFRWQGVRRKEDIINQVRLISEFQKILIKFNTCSYNGILAVYGKEVEKIKNAYIILKYLNNVKFDILKKDLEKRIDELKKININSLIKRSMQRREITIGKLEERNLRVLDEVEIGKIKKINYNLIEEDVIEYLRKIKGYTEGEMNEFILEYVVKAGLNEESYKYIKVFVKLPNESIRYLNKFKSDIEEEKLLSLINLECNRGMYE